MEKVFLICFTIVLLFFSCQKSVDTTDTFITNLNEISPTTVAVIIVEERPFEFLVHTSGKIQPQIEAQIFVKSEGLVKKLMVANGDFVSKGQLLAELDNEKQKLEMEKAEAMLIEKRIAFEDQKLSFGAAKDSTIRKAILDNIRYTSGLVAAELSHKQANFDLEQTKIKSPIDGVIASLLLREHNPVMAGQAAAFIHNPNFLLVDCPVTETDALLLRRNYSADVIASGYASPLKASILYIDQRVDEKTNLVLIQLKLTSTANLIPGMSVEVILKAPSVKALLVPKEAIVIKNGKAIVFTKEGGLAKWNYVTTGRENGTEIEILNGLTKGKKVITTNNLQLAHDAPVRTLN